MKNQYTSCIVPTRTPKVQNDQIAVIILAANISYGMKSYGPKSLLAINNTTTLLEYQIELIRQSFPKSDIILVTGFSAEKMIKKRPLGVRIVENQLFETTNESEQIRLALNCCLSDSVLLIKDSVIFNAETFKNISQNGSCIIYDSQNKFEKNDIGVTVVDGYGTIFSYDIPTKWCHIVYLTGKDLQFIKWLCSNKENSKLYTFELLNMLLSKSEKIKAIEPVNMEISKIDNSRDLEKIRG